MTEYKGWDNYIRSKIISCGSIGMCKKYPNMRHEFYDECDKAKEHFDTVSKANQYLKIKEEWKGAVDEYFGVEKTNDNSFRLIKDLNMEFGTLSQRVSNLNERINQITDCGHGKLKQMVTPLHQANVIGRIEALEDWRTIHKDHHVGSEHNIEERIKELETNYEHLKIRDNVLKDDLEGLDEWQRSLEHKLHACDGDKKKVIDKSAWNEIREFLTHVTGQESKGLLRYDMVHSITGHPVSFDWIKKINKLVEEQDK